MAEKIEAAHRNLYHTISREAFAAAVDDLYAAIPHLLDHEVIVELTRIVAMVGDGHTELWIGPGSPSGFRQYPVRFYVFEEGSSSRPSPLSTATRLGRACFRLAASLRRRPSSG